MNLIFSPWAEDHAYPLVMTALLEVGEASVEDLARRTGLRREVLARALSRVAALEYASKVTADGRNFHVIGWAAFVINTNGVTWTSSTRQLVGHFTTFIATDLAAGDPLTGATDFGVHVVTLTQ